MCLTFLVCNVYGIENIKQSLFENLSQDQDILSVGIRVVFLIIFLNNIPFLFYPGKLSILNALQEYRVGYFSKILEENIQKTEETKATDNKSPGEDLLN